MNRFVSRSLLAAAIVALPALANAAIISQWDFNSNPADGNTSTGTTAPAIGTGTLANVGGITNSFSSGSASGGSSDPAPAADNSGYQTTGYPAIGGADETAGIEVKVSTFGFNSISINFDQRHSNTSSRFISVHYTLDGSTFTRLTLDNTNSTPGVTPPLGNPASTPGLYGATGTFSSGVATSAGDDWFNGRSVNFSSIPGANNNPNFGFRILTSKDGLANFTATNPTSTYAGTGTLRFDMVTINGEVIPEPSTFVLAGVGLAGVLALGLRRRS
ncbi:MAG: PEP-CTERM sorting domain-containing protein [Pirellulales bacterium]|nr:PEP-CTERM sorting domain-containing protein [Pirellulales bacterium]